MIPLGQRIYYSRVNRLMPSNKHLDPEHRLTNP